MNNNWPLQVAKLTFTLRFHDVLKLGKYPAITIRGGLGYALKRVACTCEGERHDTDCLYAMLYEEREGVYVDEQYIPYTRPFVIQTGINERAIYNENALYTFELLLFGQAISHIDYFIIAMKQFGRKGIGEQAVPFTVEHVVAHGSPLSQIIYEQNQLLSAVKPLAQTVIAPPFVDERYHLRCTFTTPLRLQVQGENQETIAAEALVDNLLRRIRSLLYFHHQGQVLPSEVAEVLLEEAFDCEVVDEDLRYVQYKRFSTRQQRKSIVDGVQGYCQLVNVPASVAQLLYIGQFLHIGKQTVFGLGAYRLEQY